ncbi:MAG TPA: hypothetical protein VL171_06960 [Verrucomicrobiae bacterium]|nr:hypothetical protein [Verrucomicrobiae bacterium]
MTATKLIVTVDTEADNQWALGRPQTLNNLDWLPRFQSLCTRFGFKPTYLCTYEVVQSERFDRLLRPWHEQGLAEIGAHLHPWSNPPYEMNPPNFDERPYPSELPEEMFARKMEALTQALVAKLRQQPVSYRAGRWGFSHLQIPALLRLGYKVDSSVTPLVSWEHTKGRSKGGPDFRHAPVEPYFLDASNARTKGDSGLYEVPVTILYTTRMIRNREGFREWILQHRHDPLGKTLNTLFPAAPQWLRPSPSMTSAKLKAVCRAATRLGLPVLVMMLHSSELMPGGSPRLPTAESVERLVANLGELLEYLAGNQCHGETLSEFAQHQFSSD